MKTVALFGGSFNPPHEGHFEMAKYISDTLGVDEVWFLFSVNRLKDSSVYASTEHRMAMGKIMAQHYPHHTFVMSNIEEQLGTHITYDVLTGLKDNFSNHNFIWVMGADNLAGFHKWENFEKIIDNFPIAIVDRPSYTKKALNGYTALTYAHLETSSAEELSTRKNGWCLLQNPKIDISSSSLLTQLRSGKKNFKGPFKEVRDYIVKHKLYGVGKESSKPTPKDNLDRHF